MLISDYLSFTIIILSIVFFLQLVTYKYSHGRANRILAFYMALIAIYFTIHKARDILQPTYYSNLSFALLPLLVSFNPFYYLYVKALTKEKFRFIASYLLHFIPGIILLFLFIIQIIVPSDKLFFLIQNKNHIYFSVIIYYLQVLLYVGLILDLLIKHRRNVLHYFSYTENISLQWLWIFIIILILFTVFDAMAFFTTIFNAYHRLAYWISMNLFIIFLGYFGIKQGDIYIKKIQLKPDEHVLANTNGNYHIISEVDKDHAIKYEKSSITEEMKNKILEQLIFLMENEKIYQNPQITIDDFAERLKINKKYISQVINEKLQKNFFQFVNEYRVRCVIEKLDQDAFKQYTLEALGGLCGFHSRTSLIYAFKKITGQTPSAFKRLQHNE